MATRQLNGLRARTIATDLIPMRYCERGALYVQISGPGNKAGIRAHCGKGGLRSELGKKRG